MIHDMGVHTIMLPDRVRGREPRAIVWDDDAGTVAGSHFDIPWFRKVFAASKPVTVGDPGRTWDLLDPAHDPSEFLLLLERAYWPVLDEPLRSTLPPVFDGVTIPPGNPGEILYARDPEGRSYPLT